MVEPRKPRRKPGENRERIIAAALIEFGMHGYDGTSTAMITKRAGLPQPHLYRAFATKSELFLVCFDRLNQVMIDRLRSAVVGIDDPLDRLRAMGNAFMELLSEDPSMSCYLQIFAAGGHEGLQGPIRERFLEVFQDLLEISEAPRREVARFFSVGLLLSGLSLIGLAEEMVDDLRLPPK